MIQNSGQLTADEFKLTQYSHGAGCGCKIAPKVLDEILKSSLSIPPNKKLLVGNSSRDDAAVFELNEEMALISTTDFFTPIVDDAFDFGRIAAANSISDIYAMGGKPLIAIAVLGWPIEKIPPSIAQIVIDGGRTICQEAGIPLAGGHSIDSLEPIFGLAVTGIVSKKNLKKNNTAKKDDLLFLTKPLGVGVLSTAQKRGKLSDEHLKLMVDQMSALNKIGEELGKMEGVTAMTDITGFGLLGHLIELAEGSELSAEISYNKIHVLDGVRDFITQRVFPDATTRNWNGYFEKVRFEKGINVMEAFTLLPDPQTNGGLLFSINKSNKEEVISLLSAAGLTEHLEPIGKLIPLGEKIVEVKK